MDARARVCESVSVFACLLGRHRQIQTHTQTHTDTQTHRPTETHSDTETHRDRDRDRDRDRVCVTAGGGSVWQLLVEECIESDEFEASAL
eukprot:2122716-Rhodomonas_salina.3